MMGTELPKTMDEAFSQLKAAICDLSADMVSAERVHEVCGASRKELLAALGSGELPSTGMLPIYDGWTEFAIEFCGYQPPPDLKPEGYRQLGIKYGDFIKWMEDKGHGLRSAWIIDRFPPITKQERLH